MLEIVLFDNGRYGIRNAWTGIILTKRNGEARSYRTPQRAVKGAERIERKMSRAIRSLSKI